MKDSCLRFVSRIVAFAALGTLLSFHARGAVSAEVVEVRKIWDGAPHSAFTDLLRWHDQWWCVFRESDAHVGGNGAIRVLTSKDGSKWESAARLTENGIDLRDPKICATPKDQLMLTIGGSVYEGKTLKNRRPRVSFSSDGRAWTAPQPVLADGDWMWRVTWHDGMAYGAVYRSGGRGANDPDWQLAVYQSRDGVEWQLLKKLDVTGRPNETTFRFGRDGEMIALVRREGGDFMGMIGRSRPPYQDWSWTKTNYRLGGPNLIQLPSGTWIVGTRDYTHITKGTAGTRTIVAELKPNGQLEPLATVPSDGDTSYPGMVWQDGMLWMSYYSSHEGKTAIYLAKIKLTER